MDMPDPFSKFTFQTAVASTLSADLASSPFQKHIFRSEIDLPLLIPHKLGSKLYKKLILLNKNKESMYYSKDSFEELNNQLELLYCAKKNEPPSIIVFDSRFSLGRGTQGFVCLGQQIYKDKNIKNGVMVAVKISKLSTDRNSKDFNNEKTILSKQNRFRGGFIEKKPFNKVGYLVQEFCYGRTFFDWCYQKTAYNKKTKQYVYERNLFDSLFKKQVVNAIITSYHELHHKYGILHRDIKPENIMINITPENIVTATIIDFSTSCLIQDSDKTFSGTPGYAPEETLKPMPERPFYSLQTEYWSIGTICAAWISQFNYLSYLDKKMLVAKQQESFIPQYSQLDLYKALPDIFNMNVSKSLPGLQKRSVSSSSSYSYASMSWDEFLLESIRWLARENVNLRPAPFEVTKMLEHLSLYEKYDKLDSENIDPILIEKMTITPPCSPTHSIKKLEAKNSPEIDPSIIKNDAHLYQLSNDNTSLTFFSPRKKNKKVLAKKDATPTQNLENDPENNPTIPQLNPTFIKSKKQESDTENPTPEINPKKKAASSPILRKKNNTGK